MPLDFVQLTQSHTGEYLAQMVQHIVEKFGLENRMCTLFFHHLIVYQLTHTSFSTDLWNRCQQCLQQQDDDGQIEETSMEVIQRGASVDTMLCAHSQSCSQSNTPTVWTFKRLTTSNEYPEDSNDADDKEEPSNVITK
jgi:hypothetical protein